MSAAPERAPRPTPIRGTSHQDRPLDPAPARRRRLVVAGGLVAALLVLVALAVPALRGAFTGERAVPAERVRLATVERGRFVSDVAAQGVVVAALSPTLIAPAPGTVTYAVRAGETVRRGQPLATVDSPELRNQLAREQAALESQEATLARESIEIRRRMLTSRQGADNAAVKLQAAEREFQRAENSWNVKVISRRDYDKARDELEAARIDHRHAIESSALEEQSLQLELRMRRLERDRQRLTVQDLQRRADELVLRSPVDGIVGNLAVPERASVAVSAPLVTVVDPSVYEVEFTAPDAYAGVLRPGMSAQVSLGGTAAQAAVAAVSPEVRQGQIVGRLRFADAQPAGLSQNQRVAVRVLVDEREDVLKVERGGWVDSGGGRVAWRVADGVATPVPVTLGATGSSAVEIRSGLAAGDRIVVSNLDAFAGAPRVRLVD